MDVHAVLHRKGVSSALGDAQAIFRVSPFSHGVGREACDQEQGGGGRVRSHGNAG